MLNLDPASLLMEITAAEELRKRIIHNTVSLVRRYVGNWYRTDQRSGKPRPENMIFNFVATMLPKLVFDNPAVTVSAKRAVTHKPIARYMEMGINGWIKEVDLKSELEMLAMDTLFAFGVAKIGLEPRGDYAGSNYGVEGRFNMEALSPFFRRVPAANVIIDSQCDTYHSARLLGHQFQRDLTDLQGDERYDQAVVEKLTADDQQAVGKTPGEQAIRDPQAAANKGLRGRVTLYELYFPETRQIGTLTLNSTGGGQWIRPLSPYKGPKQGPYVFFGVYLVPDQVYPLSPIAAMAEQDQELNAHAAAAAKEAGTAKNLVLVSADQPEIADQIANAPMNSVVKIKGLNSQNVLPVALGGTTQQRLEYLNLLLQRTDRNSGQSEAARGRAQGVTATEASIADDAEDVRSEFIHRKYRDGVKDALGRVGFYFFHDPAVVAPVNFTDPTTGMESEGVFLGGVQPGQEDTDWSQFFLDIEPMSMRRVDPQQQQATAGMVLQISTTIAPLVIQFPYVNWPDILDMLGEAYNIPDLARIIFNQQGLMLIRQGMMPGSMPGVNPMLPGMMPGGASAGMQMAAQGAPVALLPGGGGARATAGGGGPGPTPRGAAGGMGSGLSAAASGRFGGPSRPALVGG